MRLSISSCLLTSLVLSSWIAYWWCLTIFPIEFVFFLLIHRRFLHILCLLFVHRYLLYICALFTLWYLLLNVFKFLCFVLSVFHSIQQLFVEHLLCIILPIGYIALSKGNKDTCLHGAYHSTSRDRERIKKYVSKI